jgi:F-type H+-transporting ATPase subunit b
MGDDQMEMLKVLMPVLIAHAVALVVIVVVVYRLIVSYTNRAVEQVRQVETEVRRREETIRRQIEEHEKDFEARKAETDAKFQKQKEEAEKELSARRDHVLAEARKEGDRIMEQAKRNEANLRQQLEQEMQEKAVEYGGQAFHLVFSEKMNTVINGAFIDELLSALDQVDAGGLTIEAGEAQFVTSHPMDQKQKKRLESIIQEKFGVSLSVRETVKPEVLGGMLLKLGNMEIDGTLATRIQEAVAEVKKSTRG